MWGKAKPPPTHLSQESILQNSISAENFSDKFSASNVGQISIQKTTDINFSEYFGQ
jgi:hypothetical protein